MEDGSTCGIAGGHSKIVKDESGSQQSQVD